MRPDSVPPNDNTHHGIGHVARYPCTPFPIGRHRRIAHPSEPVDYRGDLHSQALTAYRDNAGQHVLADGGPVEPREDGITFALLADICSRDLPAGVQR
jgi:hypothetical protein